MNLSSSEVDIINYELNNVFDDNREGLADDLGEDWENSRDTGGIQMVNQSQGSFARSPIQ